MQKLSRKCNLYAPWVDLERGKGTEGKNGRRRGEGGRNKRKEAKKREGSTENIFEDSISENFKSKKS